MKKILLISDTHGYIDNVIIKYAKWADEVWHAGDIGSIKIIDELKKDIENLILKINRMNKTIME